MIGNTIKEIIWKIPTDVIPALLLKFGPEALQKALTPDQLRSTLPSPALLKLAAETPKEGVKTDTTSESTIKDEDIAILFSLGLPMAIETIRLLGDIYRYNSIKAQQGEGTGKVAKEKSVDMLSLS